MTQARQYIHPLTGLRAVAALWVVFYHIRRGPVIREVFDLGPVTAQGYWGVDVFFVLSGFVLSYVYESEFAQRIPVKSYLRYLVLRLGRMYPVHLFSFVCVLFLLVCRLSLGGPVQDLGTYGLYDAAMNLGLLHAWGFTDRLSWNTVSWAISAEWFAYLFLAAPLLRYAGKARPSFVAACALGLWCAFVVFYVPRTASRNLDITYNFGIVRIAVEFFAGYATYRIAKGIHFKARTSDVLVAGSIIGLLCLTWFPAYIILLLPLIVLLLLGLIGNGSISARLFGSRPLVFLGEVSYAVYMMHAWTLDAFQMVLSHLQLPATAAVGGILLVVDVALVLAVATLTYYGIESPCREWVRRKIITP